MDDAQNYTRKTLRFRYHGDAVVSPPPQNYDDAIEIFKALPAMSNANEKVIRSESKQLDTLFFAYFPKNYHF